VIDSGLAVIATLGAGFDVTVTVNFADSEPPGPDAVTVKVVVVTGLTAYLPPVAVRVILAPFVPVTTTLVAFSAVTVNIDELPALISAG